MSKDYLDKYLNFYDENYIVKGFWFLTPKIEKIYLGNKEQKICRFCNRNEQEVSFKKEAHAFPELFGNKKLFSYYECDECNQKFGIGIENDLGNWSKPARSLARIRGKGGIPKFRLEENNLGCSLEFDKNLEAIICTRHDKPKYQINFEKKEVHLTFKREPYTPIAVLKAFYKIALTLLPQDEIKNFPSALAWVNDLDHSKKFITQLPILYRFYSGNFPNDEQMVALIKRKDLNGNLPYCFLLFNIGNEFYQIPIISDIYDKNMQTFTLYPFPTPWDRQDKLQEHRVNSKILDLTSTKKIFNETTVCTLGFKNILKESKTMTWETVIGLEIHVQLNTKSKIFSGASTAFGAEPNAHASVVECALPGVLPVMNREVVEKAIKLGLALNAKINQKNVFDRKNYFYPDLPKGYQISQLDLPIVEHGKLDIVVGDEVKTINVTRAHMEEDAGKSVHEGLNGATGIDLNRAGTPLLEVVSEPEMRSAAEAVAYAKALHGLVTWLDICDGNMAEGSFRVDANVSVRPKGQAEFGTRREIKNLNSFRFLEQAINYEVESQIEILEDGGKVQQATMLFDPDKGETRVMRLKEDAHDYRYFPDPDLLPVIISDAQMEKARSQMPELPKEMAVRFVNEFGVSEYDARLLTASRVQAAYFEEAAKASGQGKLVANWMNGELASRLNKEGLELANNPISANGLSGLVKKIADGTLSSKLAKQAFDALWEMPELSIEQIIEKHGLQQMTDTGAIEAIVDEVIANNAKAVEQFKSGNEKALNAIVGQVMKASKGKANPTVVQDLVKAKLQ